MNTQVDKVERVAKHELLNSAGEVTAKWEEAAGIRYTDISTGIVFEQMLKDLPAEARDMFACFGMRTISTNEASAARNSNDATGAEQVDAIRERFAGIAEGKWTSGTREGGPRIDLDVLSQAVANVMVRGGTWQESDKADKAAKVKATLEGDSKKVATFRSLEGVEAEYKRLKGGKVASAADIAALVA